MVTLVPSSYCHDDWERISTSYKKYVDEHKQSLDTLEDWLKKEPHLPHLNQNDLGVFLKITGESTEAAKEMIDIYFTHKTRCEMFQNRMADMKKIEQTLDLVEIAVIEPWIKNVKGGRISFVRLVDNDLSKFDFRSAMQVFTAVVDFELARVNFMITGVVMVMDMTGFHLGYLSKVNVPDMVAVLKYLQILEKLVVSIHVINCNSMIAQVMAFVRPFLSKELASKLHFHAPDQMDEFFMYVPKDSTPSDYGGELESMADFNAVCRKSFRHAEDWFKIVDTKEYRVNEKLRRVRAGCEEMNGSFRSLCID